IVSGDPSYIDSVYKINVENQLAIDATPTNTTRFFENTAAVTVSDGKLTLSNAPNSSNNKISFIEVVSAVPPPPVQADYVVQNLAVAPVNPIEGELISFSATVKNQGSGAASSSSPTRLRLDIDDDGTYDLTPADQITTALAASGAENESWSNVWTAQAGTHKFEVCVDVEEAISESDETNNCGAQTFIVSPPPPPTLEVTLTPNIKVPSATSTLRVVDLTANASGTAEGTINYTFYCDRSDTGTNITEPWDAKFDNESSTEKTAVDVCSYSLPGTYSAKVIVERDVLVAEARAAITVKEPPPPGAMGPLYQLSSNPRYFSVDGVDPVYLTGSHTWMNLVDRGASNPPPAFDYTDYINQLKSWDHNFIRLWAWEPTRDDDATTNDVVYWNAPQPWARTASSTALDGLPKFDLNILNQDYFDRLRQRVIEARESGIYVSIMLFEGYNVDKAAVGPDYGWNAHPFHRSNNVNGIDGDPNNDGHGREIHQLPGEGGVQAINDIQKTYVQKVIDTVNDLDNVLYEIANEAPNATTSWQYDLINYIKSYETGKPAQHPVGMTFQWADGNNTTLFNSPADWISTRDSMTNPPVASGTKVIISDSDHHCGSNCTDGDWVWRDFTRGRNPIYMDDWGTRASSTFYQKKRTSARNAMGQTNLYAKKMNLAAMTPRGDLASTGFALANPGLEYLIYQPTGGSFSVDLSVLSNTFSVEWLNVQSGAITSGGTITGGTTQTFTPPFGGPAVLYLKEQI
ncbi:hypothetical protein HYS84_03765, partial [Candidatus Saccharibacteria bacterium]|nr:hypothetical protein [Candidatus Saccharibacteria bacterium]